MNKIIIDDKNKGYGLRELHKRDLDPDPFKQFERWFEYASDNDFIHPNALALATADARGRPSVRMILLKGFDKSGFVFYTNSESRKGKELLVNPWASIVFWWDKLERQVRIEGKIENVSEEEAESYFRSRPEGSQIGTWASNQSRVIGSREELDKKYSALEESFKNSKIPRPPYWAGYRLIPSLFEYWQGRPNRLHDRLQYRLSENKDWVIERLAP